MILRKTFLLAALLGLLVAPAAAQELPVRPVDPAFPAGIVAPSEAQVRAVGRIIEELTKLLEAGKPIPRGGLKVGSVHLTQGQLKQLAPWVKEFRHAAADAPYGAPCVAIWPRANVEEVPGDVLPAMIFLDRRGRTVQVRAPHRVPPRHP